MEPHPAIQFNHQASRHEGFRRPPGNPCGSSQFLPEYRPVRFSEFHENHSKFTEKGNKAAATRARKAVGELKKLVTEYRKASVAESKRS